MKTSAVQPEVKEKNFVALAVTRQSFCCSGKPGTYMHKYAIPAAPCAQDSVVRGSTPELKAKQRNRARIPVSLIS